MTLKTAVAAAQRIGEHSEAHGVNRPGILFHGGEPTLLGVDQFEELLEAVDRELTPRCRPEYGMQTNAVRFDKQWLDICERRKVQVGVSCDGPPRYADRLRVDHYGRGRGDEVERALQLLQGSSIFSGILCVIDVDADPIEVWRYLTHWEAPMIDFLLPHAHWASLPRGRSDPGATTYAEWLIPIFDSWIDGSHPDVRIRYFEEIICRTLGGSGTLESLGTEPVTLLVISVEGHYEGVDSLKATVDGAWTTGLNVFSNSVDSVFTSPLIIARQTGAAAIATECRSCRLLRECGGGYFPHRYHPIRGFNAPSVYCADIMRLVDHIHDYMSRRRPAQ